MRTETKLTYTVALLAGLFTCCGPRMNPGFEGTWTGVRTVSAADLSTSSDPYFEVTIARAAQGAAQLACPREPLLIDGIDNHAASTNVAHCMDVVPSCPGMHYNVSGATLDLHGDDTLTITETLEISDCVGKATPLAWTFTGTRGHSAPPPAPAPTPAPEHQL